MSNSTFNADPSNADPSDNEYALFGADIALGNNFQAAVAANGELVLVEGCACAVQMLALRLFVPLGSLFYDVDFGARVLFWVREESTPASRAGLVAEIETRVNLDPHISPGSAVCNVLAWNHEGVELALDFTLIEQTHPDHLVLRLGPAPDDAANLTLEIIKHANPRADTCS